MANDKEIDKFQKLVYIIVGILSFFFLAIMLVKHIKIKQKDIIIHSLIIFIFSEMINSIHKIINIFKADNTKSTITKNICTVQKYIGLYSDICTPLANIFLSKEIYYLVKKHYSSYCGLKPSYYLYLFTFIISFLLSIIIVQIDNIENDDKTDLYACYINKYTLIAIGIIVLLLIIICFYSFQSFMISRKKKKEFEELQEELNSDNEDKINNTNESYQNIKQRINKVYTQNIRFVFLILFVWVILIIIRMYYYFATKGKRREEIEGELDERLKMIFRIHSIISSGRGLFFYFVYSNIDFCSNEKKKNNIQLNLESKNQDIINLFNSNKNKNYEDDDNEPYKQDDDEKISNIMMFN